MINMHKLFPDQHEETGCRGCISTHRRENLDLSAQRDCQEVLWPHAVTGAFKLAFRLQGSTCYMQPSVQPWR